MNADLIVDASGAMTRIDQWFANAGILPIAKTHYPSDEGYATRTFQMTEPLARWNQLAVLRCPPVRHRGAYLFNIENGRWMLTLVGAGEDCPPSDEEGYRSFALSLKIPAIEKLLSEGTEIGSIKVYRKMESTYRDAAKHASWPAGLILLGDSICKLNPVFGQGITAAVLATQDLQKALGNMSVGWEQRFHQRLFRTLHGLWLYSIKRPMRIGIDSAFSRWLDGRVMGALKILSQAAPKSRKIHFKIVKIQSRSQSLLAALNPVYLAYAVFLRSRKLPPQPTDIFGGPSRTASVDKAA